MLPIVQVSVSVFDLQNPRFLFCCRSDWFLGRVVWGCTRDWCGSRPHDPLLVLPAPLLLSSLMTLKPWRLCR